VSHAGEEMRISGKKQLQQPATEDTEGTENSFPQMTRINCG